MAKQPKRKTRAEKVDPPVQDIPTAFDSPESSLVLSAAYDPDTETMILTLRSKPEPKNYTYNKFPASVWAEFVQASSKGKFFGDVIRPQFAGKLRD